jgi:peroxiredoxin Q/BCP
MPLFGEMDAVILGISPDSTQSHRNFIDKQALEITLLSDPEKTVHKAYKAWGVKKNYGKEYEGVIRSTYIISPDQLIAAVWQNVKVRIKRKNGEVRHADEVREKLKELQS